MTVGDRHREMRNAVGEVGRAVERIDDPQMLGGDVIAECLFAEHRVIGKRFADHSGDGLFAFEIGVGHQVRDRLGANRDILPESSGDHFAARFGGRFRVRGGELDIREGDWPWPRLVIIEFQSKDAARLFYDSPEYQKILPLRQAASEGALAIVEGA